MLSGSMKSDPLTLYRKEHHTQLKSWVSSVFLHLILLLSLFYFLQGPESGLGNRQGTLADFRKVGLHLKEPETDQFEQLPIEEATETNNSEQDTVVPELTSTSPSSLAELPDPFAEPPLDLSLPPALTGNSPEIRIPQTNSGMDSGGAESTAAPPSGSPNVSSEAPLGVGESAFMGIRSEGNRVVFLLDHSESMQGTWNQTQPKPLDYAKYNLKQSLSSLTAQHRFQIIFYNRTYLHLSGNARAEINLLPATEKNKTRAVQFINNIRAGNSTRHLPALQAALSVKPDIIYFLTDSESELTRNEMDFLHRMSRNTQIHCIEFGKGPLLAGTGTSERNFLQVLADLTDGEFRYYDINQFTMPGT